MKTLFKLVYLMIKVVAVICTLFVISAVVVGVSKSSTPPATSVSISATPTATPMPMPPVAKATPTPAPAPVIEPETEPEPVITISADALAKAFDDNEIAAEATYGGTKRITVVGRIDSIGVEIMGRPYVVIEAGGTLTGIQCVFSKADKETLAKYSKGLRVAITGQMRFGAVLGHIMRDCTIAPTVKKAARVEKAIAVRN